MQLCFENGEGLHTGRFPKDEFTGFPVVKELKIDEKMIEVKLQYHVAQDELSEEVMIYRTEIEEEKAEWLFEKSE